MEELEIIYEITRELRQAEKKHPEWPDDKIYQAAIMMEEAGEAMRAAVQVEREKGFTEAYKKEVIQTAAMCFRILKNLENEVPYKDVQNESRS